MFENLGGAELMLVFLVILIFFGPKKIPELAATFGKGLRKFREAKAGMEEQFRSAIKEPVEAMRDAQKNFNSDFAETRKGIEKRVNSMLNEQTQAMRDSGELVKSQVEDAVKSFQESQQSPTPQIPLFTTPPKASSAHDIIEPVPGGVRFHQLS